MPKTPDFKHNRTVFELISDTRKPKLEPDTNWWKIGASEAYGISFQNSWANVGGSGVPDAQFTTDEDGWVRFRGLVDGGAVGSTLFNMPTEARPEAYEPFVVVVEGSGTANVGIYPNGDVILESFN